MRWLKGSHGFNLLRSRHTAGAVLSGLLVLSGCSDTESGASQDNPDVFEGLSAPVEIKIDAQGIPHIYAQTDEDLYYAAGYQMATDRLFQMDVMRRRALGRRAELLGERYYDDDQLVRVFDLRRWGAANAIRTREEDPKVYSSVVAWVAGVNKRIAEVRDGQAPLPYGFGPQELDYMPELWKIEEHFAISKLLMFGNSNSLERELLATIVQRNFPDAWNNVQLARPAFPVATMPPDELPQQIESSGFSPELAPPPIDATPEEIGAAVRKLRETMSDLPRTGSNNWAIAGEHTANGRPLIAGDPHQPLDSPSLMYAQHLNSLDGEGTFDVMGWSFAGAAGVHLGHNRHLQWTATTNFGDVMDIWQVQFDGRRVKVGNEWVDVVARTEDIEVAGEGVRPLEVFEVPGYGVLLPDDLLPIALTGPNEKLLLNWTGFGATGEEMAFLNMALAQNVDEYEQAADFMDVGGFNFVAADARDITYRVNIQVPDRGDPSARQMPYIVLDGNDPATYWDGTYLPPDKLPRSRAASRGWIATANTDPWGFTFDGDVSNDPWYYGYFFASGHRAHRLQDELTQLTSKGGLTVEHMKALQTDTRSALSEMLLPVLENTWSLAAQDEELAELYEDPDLQVLVTALGEWDRRMDIDSSGAVIFHIWLLYLTDEVVGDELSILYQTILEEEAPFAVKMPALAVTEQYPNSKMIMQEGRDYLVLRALERTKDYLVKRFGGVDPSNYQWGDIHGTYFDNPFGGELDGGWTPTPGGEDTINVSSSRFLDENGVVAERFDSGSGAIFRVVTSFDDDGVPQSWGAFPRGNSGEPDSPHFDDTLDTWAAGEYTRMPFLADEVEAATKERRTLDPVDHPSATPEFGTTLPPQSGDAGTGG